MPKYRITSNGGLKSGGQLHPVGTVLEMSEADALSLPAGCVEAVKAAPAPAPVVSPVPTPAPKKAPKEKP